MSSGLLRAGALLRVIVLVGSAAYLLSRLVTSEPAWPVDWIGYSVLVFCAAASAWIAGERPDADRLGSRFLAVAVACWGIGVFIQGFDQFILEITPYPSWADVWYLLFVPFSFLAVGRLLIRSRSVSIGEMLDAIVVGLAVVSLGAAIALQPTVAALGGDRFATFTQLMYPVSDIVLLAFVLALATSQGFRLSQRAVMLVSGLAVFAIGDTVYFVRAVSGTYDTGTLLDATWMIGILLLCDAPWRPSRLGGWRDPRGASTVATVIAMGVAVVILVQGAVRSGTLAWFVAVPATATLVVAVVRLAWSVREAQRTARESTLARVDSLTELPNRRAFLERMNAQIIRGEGFEVLLIDLDRFKEINDVLGHHVGDLLLTAVADRFAQARLHGSFLARIGGDEFGVVTPAGDGGRQAERLLDSLAATFPIEGVPLRVGASIGIARYPHDASSESDVLRHADVAMYRAKRTRLGHAMYDTAFDAVDGNRLQLASELAEAVNSSELVLWYQPVVDAQGHVISLEALVRWDHPRLGLLMPWTFLPIAQQTGLMRALTANVIGQAVRDAGRLMQVRPDLRVWMNLDSDDLAGPEMATWLAERCESEGVDPSCLGVEVTEEALVSEPAAARAGVERLRELGIAVAIDDFGTGYSSLGYLQHLPVTHLKIDRTFVSGLVDPDLDVAARSLAVTRTIIQLAHELGIRAVAEGVEVTEQQDELVALGCDALQGYLHGRPMPLEAVMSRLRAG